MLNSVKLDTVNFKVRFFPIGVVASQQNIIFGYFLAQHESKKMRDERYDAYKATSSQPKHIISYSVSDFVHKKLFMGMKVIIPLLKLENLARPSS